MRAASRVAPVRRKASAADVVRAGAWSPRSFHRALIRHADVTRTEAAVPGELSSSEWTCRGSRYDEAEVARRNSFQRYEVVHVVARPNLVK
jgi:hypothetical protein